LCRWLRTKVAVAEHIYEEGEEGEEGEEEEAAEEEEEEEAAKE
jgi:hypothetical protein